MAIKKGDFVEVIFTGKVKSTGEVFDTNNPEDAKDENMKTDKMKPYVLSVGHKMLPTGLDDDIRGKELQKEYMVEVKPEDAFGKRDKEMVKMVPTKLFHEQNIRPERGMSLNLDGRITKVLSSAGGRTLVDFNHPLAGKEVVYTYTITRIVEDKKQKSDALQEFFFKQVFDSKQDAKTLTITLTKEIEPLAKMLAPKFEEIVGLKLETIIKEEKKNPDTKTSEHKH